MHRTHILPFITGFCYLSRWLSAAEISRGPAILSPLESHQEEFAQVGSWAGVSAGA
jgi:hypothetical protein